MIVGDGEELGGGGPKVHGDHDFVNEFGGFGADAKGTEDFAGMGMGQHFYKTVGFSHGHRFAMIIKRVAGY